jgi:hypothetical protein
VKRIEKLALRIQIQKQTKQNTKQNKKKKKGGKQQQQVVLAVGSASKQASKVHDD